MDHEKDIDKEAQPGKSEEKAAGEKAGEEKAAEEKAVEAKAAKEKRPKKRWPLWGKIAMGCLLAIITVSAFLVGDYYYRLSQQPSSFFPATAANPMVTQTPLPPDAAARKPEATKPQTPPQTPTPDPLEQLAIDADRGMMKDIVNIMLIGVDYADERDTWGGKHAYHSDVMIVVAVNFEQNTVDMISLPRDTYARIPGVDGIYKLNASIDCGGGYPEGLPKVTEAAAWMLGGIPVDYYYAVTMPVVKELVDAIGGVDYELDLNFTMMGRKYQKGMQHLDGQGVLDYFRVRKNVSQAGDLNRVNRQKKLLVAIFQKMKQSNLLVTLPQLVKAFEGKMLTNTSLSQTAALALFGVNLPEESIRMHSMDGAMRNIFNWNFCLTNQTKRVELIRAVYGIDVEPYREYSLEGAVSRWNKMRSSKFYSNAEKVIAAAAHHTPSTTITVDEYGNPVEHTDPVPAQLEQTKSALSRARNSLSDSSLSALQSETNRLAGMIGYPSLSWGVSYTNEIKVDAR